jgi:short-subunit dehydrogenase
MGAPIEYRVAVVTGASSGIGWELARQLAASGCRVGLVARREERLRELAALIESTGGSAAVAPADVSVCEDVGDAVARVRQELGPIDLLIACAGVGRPTRLDPVNVADVAEMLRVNVLGVVHAIAAVLPEMLCRGRGHLAAVSSLAGYHGLPAESGYCASKAAVNAYLDGLRVHLRGRGVRVTTLCPGFVRTPMTEGEAFPMPGLLEAPDAARRMLRALRAGRKVYDFPARTALMTRLARRLPDWVIARAMQEYVAHVDGEPRPRRPLAA